MGQVLLILDRRKPLGDPITERTVDPEELRVKGVVTITYSMVCQVLPILATSKPIRVSSWV